jgi:putative hemolysin
MTMGATFTSQVATAPYVLRFARSAEDLAAVQRLRFEVFNLELKEGLAQSYENRLDADAFDAVCEHLMVKDALNGAVVGTYRLQTGTKAAQCLGYYCAQEFDFSTFATLRSEMLELGRACIAREHRSMQVICMLWRGIAEYASEHGARYLFGCSSLTSQEPAMGHATFAALQTYLAPAPLQTMVLPTYQLPAVDSHNVAANIPKLLSAYLALGAWICSPPALDTSFGTIDFLTCLDLQSSHMAQRRKRFGITS